MGILILIELFTYFKRIPRQRNHEFWSQSSELILEGFVTDAKCEQDCKDLTYSWFTGTQMHGFGVYYLFDYNILLLYISVLKSCDSVKFSIPLTNVKSRHSPSLQHMYHFYSDLSTHRSSYLAKMRHNCCQFNTYGSRCRKQTNCSSSEIGKAFWLDVQSHVTSFNQSEWFISPKCSYTLIQN